MSSFYTSVTKTTTIWGTFPEIKSETDEFFVILGHFLPLDHSNNPENQILKKWKKPLEMS